MCNRSKNLSKNVSFSEYTDTDTERQSDKVKVTLFILWLILESVDILITFYSYHLNLCPHFNNTIQCNTWGQHQFFSQNKKKIKKYDVAIIWVFAF